MSAVIARVPFDEGTLTGTLTKESKWPEGDWRNTYFVPENLIPSVERAESLKVLLRDWNRNIQATEITLPELALRFILSQSGCQHDHSRNAQALARESEYRRERCRPVAGGVARAIEGTPLGPQTHAMVAVEQESIENPHSSSAIRLLPSAFCFPPSSFRIPPRHLLTTDY